MNEQSFPWDAEQDNLGTATFGGDFVPFNGSYADGVYPMVCRGVETVTQPNKWKNNEPQTRLRFHFVPDDYTGEGHLSYWTSMSMHEKSHFPKVCLALGVPVPTEANPSIRKSMFVGKTCRGLLLNEASTKKPGEKYLRIKQLLPSV